MAGFDFDFTYTESKIGDVTPGRPRSASGHSQRPHVISIDVEPTT